MRLVLTLLLAGCGPIWRAIDDPGHYGTAYQRREYAHALPCVNWCAMQLGLGRRDRARMTVARDGLSCLCVLDAPGLRTLPGQDERLASDGGSWLRTTMPAGLVGVLSAENEGELDAAVVRAARDAMTEACK